MSVKIAKTSCSLPAFSNYRKTLKQGTNSLNFYVIKFSATKKFESLMKKRVGLQQEKPFHHTLGQAINSQLCRSFGWNVAKCQNQFHVFHIFCLSTFQYKEQNL